MIAEQPMIDSHDLNQALAALQQDDPTGDVVEVDVARLGECLRQGDGTVPVLLPAVNNPDKFPRWSGWSPQPDPKRRHTRAEALGLSLRLPGVPVHRRPSST